ncbi:MAG TPA: glutamate--tRNA ligase [Candidatus Thermoplasmatota archaeon]|nr:glutamate--tRNA ligase [Candidatus Thermoplasmatota archaeon]
MSDDFEPTVKALARKYALENALKHGKANPGAVIGKVMAEGGDAVRPRAKDVPALANAVIAEVNAMSPEAMKEAFAAFEGTLVQRAKVEREGPLKPLPNAVKGKVVLRLAPNPSGPPHFGHGRGMIITSEYKRMYDGQFILRFDDTDTTVKPPWMPAYQMFPETVAWLCQAPPDRIIYASDHMEQYVDWALELIRRGGAYVCECVGDTFRELKEKATACPHREQPADLNEAKFKTMVDGGYRRGAAVLRVKTDIAHKDPAMRDWVAFRIAEEPHPRLALAGKPQYSAWPLLDFQSAIDDHLEGVTHIIRGKDLRDSTAKQEFLYAHLGWTYPETMYWGRVSVHEFGKFSKSILNKAIEAGEYTGWDDPRLPTFPALRRRGFTPEGIRNFWLSFGITEKDIAASIVTLEAENKKILEPIAHRYFFVADPKPVTIEGSGPLHATPALLPDEPKAGVRDIIVHDGKILLAAEDAKDGPLRLKDLGNIHLRTKRASYEGNDLAWARANKAPIVHWVPAAGAVRVTLVTPDNERVEGMAEPMLAREKVGAPVQLERVGFARVDEKRADGSLVLYFTHK